MMNSILDWFRSSPQHRACCFHFGRCGSTLLGNMLNSHPQLTWASELFHSLHESEKKCETDQAFENVEAQISGASTRSFGFETKFQHLDINGLNLPLDQFLERLQAMAFDKFLVLKRNNYLRQAISVARGQKTKVWHVKTNEAKPKFEAFELTLEQIALGGKHRPLLACFQFLDQTYLETKQLFAKRGLDLLWLEYESDLQHDPAIGFKRTLEFLNLPESVPASASLKRLDPRPISEMLTNAKEVQSELTGTPYEWMLD